MCGIAGFINRDASQEYNKKLLTSMLETIKHRGPDGSDIYQDTQTSLGHNRLSIIDLEYGSQPMTDYSGRYIIIYNGEFYNFLEHRKKLLENGYKFNNRSDTEVILNLYIAHGTECLKFIRGMFAFAIWDKQEKSLFLARDRLGVKPLVYTQINNTLYFASEIKALLQIPEFKKEIHYPAINQYLTLQYIPSDISIFKKIEKLPPAHYLIFKNGKIKISKYWEIDYKKNYNLNFDGWKEKFMETFSEAAKLRMLSSDVPVGVFLSGGLDSTSTVAALSKISTVKLKTYTMGFNHKEFDELKYAKIVADKYGTEHNEINIDLKDYAFVPEVIGYLDEPLADSSIIPKYCISRAAREYVKVVISGDGGDESAIGYHRYSWCKFAEYYDKLPNYLRKKILQIIFEKLPDSTNSSSPIAKIKRFGCSLGLDKMDRYLRWVSYFNSSEKLNLIASSAPFDNDNKDTLACFTENFKNANSKYELERFLYLDMKTYLPNDILNITDISSMSVSIEVRAPYLDYKIYELFAEMPMRYKGSGFTKKYFLKQVFKEMLPAEILKKKKTGFSMPVSNLLRKELKYLIDDYLLSPSFSRRGYFNMEYVQHLINAHNSGKCDYGFKLWSLIVLELWHRKYID